MQKEDHYVLLEDNGMNDILRILNFLIKIGWNKKL